MPLLVWLLFTRISRAYVNPPSAQHLSTHTHTLSVSHTHTCGCVCAQEVGIMSESERQMYLPPLFSVVPSVCPSVGPSACLPAGIRSPCNSVFYMQVIILFTDTAYTALLVFIG